MGMITLVVAARSLLATQPTEVEQAFLITLIELKDKKEVRGESDKMKQEDEQRCELQG